MAVLDALTICDQRRLSGSVRTTTRRPLRCRPSDAGAGDRQSRYRAAPRLTITADGRLERVRVRLWKRELQKLCDETGCHHGHHLPPGTSKWNAIEHRLFSFISQNCEQRLW